MSALKFLQQTTEEKRTEASEAHSRASLSRNRRLPARYRSGEVYNLAEEDEEEGGGRMTMRRGILTRRRNRHSLFFSFHTCYFILLGPQSLCFVFVSIGRFVEISLINERVL